MPKGAPGDNAFDTDDSGTAEGNFRAIADHVLSLLDTRTKQVATVMDHYEATGVAPEYHGKEVAWNTLGGNTQQTIVMLLRTLVEDRGHAHDANQRAGSFVAGMM